MIRSTEPIIIKAVILYETENKMPHVLMLSLTLKNGNYGNN